MATIRTHYDNLKVARDAPDNVIRAAYKSLSQTFHPDKNPGDERAARIMALINESYRILSDPQKRREHDAWIAREEAKLRQREAERMQASPIPPQWKAPQQSAEEGGKFRKYAAAVLLWPFSLARRIFLSDPRIAVFGSLIGVAFLYGEFAPKPPPPPGPKPYQQQAPTRPIATAPAAERKPEKCVLINNANGGIKIYRVDWSDGSRTYQSRLEAECSGISTEDQKVAVQRGEENAKYLTAPNGSQWPNKAAYVHGYPVDNADGYSSIKVDNEQNESSVFVKLVSLDGANAYPVRQFYIPERSSFTLRKVTAGNYDIRYRDLSTGGLARSESFDVHETRTGKGIEYSDITMTLYKVEGGTFETYDLAESEF